MTQAQQLELTKSFKNAIETAFKQVGDGMMAQMRQSNPGGESEPPSSRRKKSDWSPSGAMEANRRLTSSVKNLNKHVGASVDIFGDLNKASKGYHSNVERTMRLYGQVQDQLTITYRAHRKMRDVMGEDVRAITQRLDIEKGRIKSEKEYLDHLEDAKKATKQFVDEVTKASSGLPSGGDGGSNDSPGGGGGRGGSDEDMGLMGKAAQFVTSKLTNLASVSGGTIAVLKDFQYALQTSSIVTSNTLTDSLQMGMTARELLEMQAQFRSDAMRSSGGVQEWTDSLRNSQMDLVAYTGSLAEANKVNANLRSAYMKLGLSLEEITDVIGKTSNGMMSNFTKMSAITGKTIGEVAEVMTKITGTDENREMLLKMTTQQRVDYLKNQTALIQKYTVLTGSVERAQAIAAQQNSNRNKGALDKYRESVRMRAAGAIVGIDPDTMSRFADLNNRAPGDLTESESKELAETRNLMSQRIKQLEGSANMHERMIAQQMVAKLDLGDLAVFDRSMDKPMSEEAIQEQQMANLAAIAANTPFAKEGIAILSSIGSVMKQSVAPLAAAALLYMARKSFDRTRLSGTGAADIPTGGTDGDDRGRGGKLGLTKLGKLAGSLGLATIAVEAVSMGVDHAWTPDNERESGQKEFAMDLLDTAGFGLLGATIGSFIPGVGTVIGGALGLAVGGLYSFTRDEYKKTETQFASERHQNEKAKHQMEMKLVQAEWERRKTNFNAFQQEAGPGFHSKLQSLMDKHNTLAGDEHQIKIDDFYKFSDLRSTLAYSLTDTELKLLDSIYKDERDNMATRHKTQLSNMNQIHQLNTEQTNAYKDLMGVESKIKALESFSDNAFYEFDNIDAKTLNSALGKGTVEESTAVLRDIAKNSGALTEAEFNKLNDSMSFSQLADSLKANGSFDYDEIEDKETKAAMIKLFDSMKAQGTGNAYIRKQFVDELQQAKRKSEDVGAKIEQHQTITVDGSELMQGKSADEIKQMTTYLEKRLSPEQMKSFGVSNATELVDYLRNGNDIKSASLTQLVSGFESLYQTQTKPDSQSDVQPLEYDRIMEAEQYAPMTYGKMDSLITDQVDLYDFMKYMKQQQLSTADINSMGATDLKDLRERIISDGEIINQRLLQAISGFATGYDVEWITKSKAKAVELQETQTQEVAVSPTGVEVPTQTQDTVTTTKGVDTVVDTEPKPPVMLEYPKTHRTTYLEPLDNPFSINDLSHTIKGAVSNSIDSATNDVRMDVANSITISKIDRPEIAGSTLQSTADNMGMQESATQKTSQSKRNSPTKTEETKSGEESTSVLPEELLVEMKKSNEIQQRMLDNMDRQHTEKVAHDDRRFNQSMVSDKKPAQTMGARKSKV